MLTMLEINENITMVQVFNTRQNKAEIAANCPEVAAAMEKACTLKPIEYMSMRSINESLQYQATLCQNPIHRSVWRWLNDKVVGSCMKFNALPLDERAVVIELLLLLVPVAQRKQRFIKEYRKIYKHA